MSNALVNGLAGAGAGIVAQIISYPLQAVNTRQRTERLAEKGTNSPRRLPATAGGTLFQIYQTHTQAERKILERKRETLLKEACENGLSGSLQEKLAEIDSMKLQPYGTFDALREVYNESEITGFWKGILPALIMVSNPTFSS